MEADNKEEQKIPDTGISGVYEVIVGVQDFDYALKYFAEFGFRKVQEATLPAEEVQQIYGVNSSIDSIRLQNGAIDSHGLVRLINWKEPIGSGVGYAPPETIGQRMSVMMTSDIFRIDDTYREARASGEKWLPTEPVAADIFDLDEGKKGFFKRPIIVRESAVYGEFFNHVFFQRYGYKIPGYGTIHNESPLKTSEFTHHDFIISAADMSSVKYLSTALGLKSEEEPVLDGDWQEGPKKVFNMSPGESHWYQGFVSPNNICGKLKMIIPTALKLDRSDKQRIGQMGITLHSFYTDKLSFVHDLIQQHDLAPTSIMNNEFDEPCFVFTGPAGCSWQIISKKRTNHNPATELKFDLTNN